MSRSRRVVKKLMRLYARLRACRAGGDRTSRPPRRIAYFAAGGIGDAVMAYAAVNRLSQSVGVSAVDLYVPPEEYPLLRVVFRELRVRPFPSAIGTVARRFSRRYDLALTNTIAAFKVAVELRAALCARESWGFRYPEEMEVDRLYDHSRPIDRAEHDADQNLGLVCRALGGERPTVESLLPDHGLDHEGVRVVIHPGSRSGYENKRWPAECFLRLIEALTDRGASVTVLVGPSELELGRLMGGHPSVSLAVAVSPRAMAGLLRRAALFVGNDSGPAHLAAFYGVPTVVLNGPVDPGRTAPRGRKVAVVWNRCECSPCHFSEVECRDNRCMKSITVDQVLGAVGGLRPDLVVKG